MYKVCKSGDNMKANGFPYCVVDTTALIDDVRAFFCEFIEAQMFVEAVDGRPNTGMKADAAIALDGDGESSTRGAAYA